MPGVCDEIREAIRRSDKSRYRIWQETGISQGHLSEFMADTKRLSIDSLETVADCLELKITAQPKGRRKASRKGR